jgi:hypothetical protein
MIVITLMLTLAAVLILALVTHAAAWSRRHRVGGLQPDRPLTQDGNSTT